MRYLEGWQSTTIKNEVRALSKLRFWVHFPQIWTELTQPTETWRENAKKAHMVEPINGNDVEMKEGYDNPAANLE